MAAFALQEQLDDWKDRSDVVYHIAAYHYFSRHNVDIAIDVVNLDAGDVQFYNRTIHMTFGLNNAHTLAEYLLDNRKLFTADDQIRTHRQHLIAHIHKYNMEVNRRQRFFMVGLSPAELNLLAHLNEEYQLKRGDSDGDQPHCVKSSGGDIPTSSATDGTPGGTTDSDMMDNEISVAAEIKECERKYDTKKGERAFVQLTPAMPSSLQQAQGETV